jgi:hypothetical protein
MPEPLSRREALAAGLAGAAALVFAPAATTAAAEPDQGAALAALVRAEQDAAFAYLDAGLGALGGALAGQEEEHSKALATQLEALGLPAPEPARGRAGLGEEALAVLEAGGDAARREAAIALERALIGGCADRLAQFDEPGILRTVATVMASHAQHLALLERAAGRDPLSSAA